jgi:hypothetical protein
VIVTEERNGLATFSHGDNKRPSVPVGLLEDKRFFQTGFVILGLSGLLRTAEVLISNGLHWKSLHLGDWIYLGFLNLVTVMFAIVFLRYLSKGYIRSLVWISLTCTAAGWMAFLVCYILGFVVHGVHPTVGKWFEIVGHTGAPLSCIVAPFMQGSAQAYRLFLAYVVNADYAIKLLFFGVCVWRYPVAQQARGDVPRGLKFAAMPVAAIVIYGLIVQSIPLFRLSLDGSGAQRGNQNIAILANLMLLGVIGIFAGIGTLIYYVAKKTK